MSKFRARGVGIRFQKSNSRHDEARHAEGALESLLVDHSLLDGMKRSVGTGQAFDGQDFLAADSMGQHRAGVVRNIIDQNRTGTAFGAVTSEFGSGETQFVAERPRQGFLFHHVNPALLAVNIDRDESVAGASRLSKQTGGSEEIPC